MEMIARAVPMGGGGAATGMPRAFLRAEGLVALGAGSALYVSAGGQLLWLLPLLLVVDLSMAGYLWGPRAGAIIYNLAHTWGTALVALGAGLWLDSPALVLAGAVLIAHAGMDRAAGYGLKYPTAFGDTHLGRIGRSTPPAS